MLQCPACRRLVIVDSFDDVRKHLSLHIHYGDIQIPITCTQSSSCLSSHSNLWNFMRHLKLHHHFSFQSNEDREVSVNDEIEADGNDSEMEIDSDIERRDELLDGFCSKCDLDIRSCQCNSIFDLKTSLSYDVLNFLLTLRSKRTIPYTTTRSILNMFESITKKILNSFGEILRQKFSTVSDLDCIPNVISSIVSELQTIQTIFFDYQSEHKIQKLYKSHPLYVSPKTVSVGKQMKTKMTAFGPVVKEINSTAQVVSIKDTCKALLKLERFCNSVFQSEVVINEPNVYNRFQDGSRFKSFPPPTVLLDVNVHPILILYIQLFSDGLGTTNPLSPAAKN